MKQIYVLAILSLPFYLLSPQTSVFAQKQTPERVKPKAVVTQSKPISATSKPENQSGQKLLTNPDIVRMVEGDFSESVILNAIQTNETRFDLSLDALFELKNAGVSQKVIEAMQNSPGGKSKQVQPAAVSPQSPIANESGNATAQKTQSSTTIRVSETKEPTGTTVPKISINADMEKVRTVLIQRFTGQGFNIDKDQPSQLVFFREAKGVKASLTGLFFGRNQNNPRQILTFVLTRTGNGVLVFAQFSLADPDDSGFGNPQVVDGKKIRKNLLKELTEIKEEAEK